MSNQPISTNEEARYFTPQAHHRLPISMDDWNRLKDLANQDESGRRWPAFVRSMSLGIFGSAVLNLVQLTVLRPAQGYPTWVWVVGFSLLFASLLSALFAQALTATDQKTVAKPLTAISRELGRIEKNFDPPAESRPLFTVDTVATASHDATKSSVASKGGAVAKLQLATPKPKRPTVPEIGLGDRVEHKTFGMGRVVAKNGDAVEIHFDRTGETKKLLLGYAPIRLAREQN